VRREGRRHRCGQLLSPSQACALVLLICGAAVPIGATERSAVLFSVSIRDQSAAAPQRVFLGGDRMAWRFGGEVFEEGPCLPGAPSPLLIGTKPQIEKLMGLKSVDIRLHGPLRGYRDVCPDQVSKIGPHGAPSGIVIDDGYHGADQVAALLAQFQNQYPTLAKRIRIGQSHEGRQIWALKISDNVDLDEEESAIVFDANIHAREYPPTEVALDIIHRLLTRYALDQRYRAWVDHLEIYVIPCLNPDGRKKSDDINLAWRKNARDNNGNGFFEINQDGVDLNRNAPFMWGSDDSGSSPHPTSEIYRGPAPASEPETQAILGLLDRLRPAYHLSMHSYSALILSPYGDLNADGPQPEPMRPLGEIVAGLCTDEDGEAYGFTGHHGGLPSNGLLTDSAHAMHGVFSYTAEIGAESYQPLYATTREVIVPGMRPGWERLLEAAHDGHARLYGRITDGVTQQPLETRIDLLDLTWPNDEHWETRADGHYEVPLRGPGRYRFRFSFVDAAYEPIEEEFEFADSPLRWNLRLGVNNAVTDWDVY